MTRQRIAALWLVLLVPLVACSDGGSGEISNPPSLVKRFVSFALITFPEAETYPQNDWRGGKTEIRYYFNRLGYLNGTSGNTTVQELMGDAFLADLRKDLDDSTRRAIYANGLTNGDELAIRVGDPDGPFATCPVTLANLRVAEWGDENFGTLLEDPSQHTPLAGTVLLPVGSDPQIAPNPELAKLIAKLHRLMKAYQGTSAP